MTLPLWYSFSMAQFSGGRNPSLHLFHIFFICLSPVFRYNRHMTKYEFTDSLRRALTGRVSAAEVDDTVRYYEEYIDSEIRLGMAEEQVLERLGDPRLLARSVIEREKAAAENATSGQSGAYEDAYGEDAGDRRSYSFLGGIRDGLRNFWAHRSYRVQAAMALVIVVLIFAAILWVIGSLILFALPILIPVVLVLLIVRLIQRGG